ncbi:MAG TPA: AI-2E family transporter [Cyclobacteriaceae bacterium]
MADDTINNERTIITRIVNIGLPLTLLVLLAVWCFQILGPFVTPAVWSIVLASTLASLHIRLTKAFRGRSAWAAFILVTILLALIVIPAVWLLMTTFDEMRSLMTQYEKDEISLPPLPTLKTWPIIGAPLDAIWQEATTDFSVFASHYKEQIKQVLTFILLKVASGSKGLLLLVISTIISGFILAFGKQASEFAHRLFNKLAGERGEHIAITAFTTIKNVANGVLGVAALQGLLAGIGMGVAGIPGAGVLGLCCTCLSVVQIGMLPVSLGVIIYAFSTMSFWPAVFFTIWMVIVGVLDNVIKPLVMGKGSSIPILILFLGSVGGFIHSGFIGLFTGAVILSVGYTLFDSWLYTSEKKDESIHSKD